MQLWRHLPEVQGSNRYQANMCSPDHVLVQPPLAQISETQAGETNKSYIGCGEAGTCGSRMARRKS